MRMIISLARFLLQKRSFDLPGKIKVKKITINRSCILVIIWIIIQVCDPKHVQSMRSHARKLARTHMKTFFFYMSVPFLWLIPYWKCVCACACRYKPRVAGEDPAAGSRSGEEQLQSCSGGETDQNHEPCCFARYSHTHTFLLFKV